MIFYFFIFGFQVVLQKWRGCSLSKRRRTKMKWWYTSLLKIHRLTLAFIKPVVQQYEDEATKNFHPFSRIGQAQQWNGTSTPPPLFLCTRNVSEENLYHHHVYFLFTCLFITNTSMCFRQQRNDLASITSEYHLTNWFWRGRKLLTLNLLKI